MVEQPTHWPWPKDMRKVWLKGPPDRWGRATSVRNVELWNEMHAYRMANEIPAARAFREAAAADGWSLKPTYEHEPVETAFRCERDGFKLQGLARLADPEPHPTMPIGEISIWCPEGISIKTPIVYPGFAEIKALTRRCPECGADDVDTVRIAFANRACLKCAPTLRKKMETPGWCD